MNEFPKFSHGEPLERQITSTKMNLLSDNQKANQIRPGVGCRVSQTPGGTTVSVVNTRPAPPSRPPLWGRLQWTDDQAELIMEFGALIPRNNGSGDALPEIEITSIPTSATPLPVAVGDKISVEVSVGVDGIATDASIIKTTSWTSSVAPSLIGGDDQSGTQGYHYVRILEIIESPDHPGLAVIKQHHTGHIDHFQPTLCENTTTSPSGGEARVLKVWNASAGRWDLRTLKQGAGIIVTENASDIEVKVDTGYAFPTSHPWKVTNAGSGNAAIAPGFVNRYYLNYADANPGNPPTTEGMFSAANIIHAAGAEYAGGTTAVSGTKYIYAEIPATASSSEYAESRTDYNVGAGSDMYGLVELYDAIEQTFGETATIVASSNDPTSYTPTSGKAAICIAKATNTAGTITVDAQYITHNPTIFVPTVNTVHGVA
jgi:hypothetical protein